MAVCPNCGTNNESGKFCCNCGTPLPAEQPVQPVQPVAEPVAAPVAQPEQPVAQPVAVPVAEPVAQPVMQPVAEPTVQPVYQQPVSNVYSQSVATAANEPKTNGMCKLGFILSLVGFATMGLTSLFGLIFSIVGLFSSKKKQEKGKGIAIAGIILSVLLMGSLTAVSALLFSDMDAMFGDLDIDKPVVTTEADEEDPDDKEELITSINWIETNDESYLTFGRKNSFKYYQSYLDTSDYYYTGKYELYFGNDAIDVVTKDYEEAGLTKDEIEEMYSRDELKKLVVLVLKNDGCWIGGENTKDEEWTSVYIGVFEEGSKKEMYLINLGTATDFHFVPESDYDAPVTATTTTSETTAETSETTAATTTSETTKTSETTGNSDVETMGDDVAGYVALTQGSWGYWTEAGLNPDDYSAVHQRINLETQTIINLTVYSGYYEDSSLPMMADILRQNMESDTGYSGVKSVETTVCGYKAYNVSGQYQDGMYLSVWLFVDKNGKMHYNSIEYFESDKASYDMFVNNYTIS